MIAKKKNYLSILSALMVLLLFSLVGYAHELSDEEIIERFNQIYHDSFHESFMETMRWLGVRSHQNPCDNWVMQEIISEVKPSFIIETGTYFGGTTLFYATVLEKINKNGRVITVDINPQVEEASKFKVFKERVIIITGDSVSPKVLKRIAKLVRNHKVLVTLDSLHAKEHVLKELNLYSKFVSVGSYIVVQDTRKGWHPEWGPGPRAAVEEFLKTNDNFVADRSKEKYLLTFYPSGFLKRVK